MNKIMLFIPSGAAHRGWLELARAREGNKKLHFSLFCCCILSRQKKSMGWGKAHLFALWLLGWVLLIHLGEPIATQHSPLSWLDTASSGTTIQPATRHRSPDAPETFCWRGGGGGGEHAHVAHQLPAQNQAGGFSPVPTAQPLRAHTHGGLSMATFVGSHRQERAGC